MVWNGHRDDRKNVNDTGRPALITNALGIVGARLHTYTPLPSSPARTPLARYSTVPLKLASRPWCRIICVISRNEWSYLAGARIRHHYTSRDTNYIFHVVSERHIHPYTHTRLHSFTYRQAGRHEPVSTSYSPTIDTTMNNNSTSSDRITWILLAS